MIGKDDLRFRGWLPTAILADGTVILWLEPHLELGVIRNHYSTSEAMAIQARRDRKANP